MKGYFYHYHFPNCSQDVHVPYLQPRIKRRTNKRGRARPYFLTTGAYTRTKQKKRTDE